MDDDGWRDVSVVRCVMVFQYVRRNVSVGRIRLQKLVSMVGAEDGNSDVVVVRR